MNLPTKNAYGVNERRPIAARELTASRKVAAWLAKTGVSANAISIVGIFLAAMAGLALAATSHGSKVAPWLWVIAIVGVVGRLLANMFDGMVAIATGTASAVGELYNEVPDRISDSAILIGAGYAVGGSLTWGYAASLAAMFTAYIRVMGKSAGVKQEFCGPMAKQQRMFIVIVTSTLYLVWPSCDQALGLAPSQGGIWTAALVLITIGSLLTTVRRLLRISNNLRNAAR